MSEYELLLLSTLLGQIMPYVADFINKYITSAKLRFWIPLSLSFIIASLYNIDQIQLGAVRGWLESGLILWSSSQAAYKMYYEGSKAQVAIRFSKGLLPSF